MCRRIAKTGSGDGAKLRKLGSKSMVLSVVILLVLLSSFPALAMLEKPFTIGGKVHVNGAVLTSADTEYTVTLEVDEVQLSRYTMGDHDVDFYTLLVPMDNDPEAEPVMGHPGKLAYIYVNGTSADKNPVSLGGYAGYMVLDIHVTIGGYDSGNHPNE